MSIPGQLAGSMFSTLALARLSHLARSIPECKGTQRLSQPMIPVTRTASFYFAGRSQCKPRRPSNSCLVNFSARPSSAGLSQWATANRNKDVC
eukprot:3506709-Amphidinium_carterae.1